MANYPLPEAIEISSKRLEKVYAFLDQAVQDDDKIPGAAILVARHGQALEPSSFGRQYLLPDSPPIRPDTIFLVASVTKPVTVAAAMLLVERGHISLDDPACAYVPEFRNRGKEAVLIRHLMTHTSGLPDMLAENQWLREQHAPLKEFVRRVCELDLDFAPGTNIQYQSMGIAMLAEIVERVAGVSLPRFLRQEIFEPLGMNDTSLGGQDDRAGRIAHVNVAEEMRGTDWGWNTPYWWHFGAPWGGMFSTVEDMFRFCQVFLDGGKYGTVRVFSPATVEAMIRDQTTPMPDIPRQIREGQAWGLGWRLAAARGWSYYGDLLSPASFGHGGATGTVVWVDPQRELICILFTTQPSSTSKGLLGRCSNLVAASAL